MQLSDLLILVASLINIFFHQNNYKFYEEENNIIINNKYIYNSEKIEPNNIAFNKGKKFISAFIPFLNCQKYILREIRYIQNQNFSDFEIIIANDFSTYNTLAYSKNYKMKILELEL